SLCSIHLTITHFLVFFSNAPSTTLIYTLSLHDALPISISQLLPWGYADHQSARPARPAHRGRKRKGARPARQSAEAWCLHACLQDRKSTRLNSSHVKISYAVFCLKKKKKKKKKKQKRMK